MGQAKINIEQYVNINYVAINTYILSTISTFVHKINNVIISIKI